jgi:hypothetical protein
VSVFAPFVWHFAPGWRRLQWRQTKDSVCSAADWGCRTADAAALPTPSPLLDRKTLLSSGGQLQLDVAAIEIELGLPLDYDRELTMVGLSNLLSGASGGFTGSYIFSQTILNLRRGVRSRLCGLIIGCFEAIVVFIPFAITSYTPKFLYGSLLVLIATDLMCEWLVKY